MPVWCKSLTMLRVNLKPLDPQYHDTFVFDLTTHQWVNGL